MDDKPSSKAEVLVVLRLVLAKKLVAEVQISECNIKDDSKL